MADPFPPEDLTPIAVGDHSLEGLGAVDYRLAPRGPRSIKAGFGTNVGDLWPFDPALPAFSGVSSPNSERKRRYAGGQLGIRVGSADGASRRRCGMARRERVRLTLRIAGRTSSVAKLAKSFGDPQIRKSWRLSLRPYPDVIFPAILKLSCDKALAPFRSTSVDREFSAVPTSNTGP